ncbi:response regulator transcription factor [Dietzia sp. PP-33]|jgi:DNA-binding NarL/FixJ family response regulator|uniref:response regulator transcription factor n=1 Tax=Dietzia sp. PP-33 TaxID=2957500 RepID=UPI0029A0E86B|nr:response regulator transcription factor [Dietzia sp. PP-33]MDX2356580.1 response regulator transcription factor [Dietzia sp. PP-33]
MRLIVADDTVLLREGLVGILERQGHQVVAQAATAPELEAAVHRAFDEGAPPDVVITDVRMPPTMSTDGLDAALRLRDRDPRLNLMLLSQYNAPSYASELFHRSPATQGSGASGTGGLGYLLKERVGRVTDFLDSLQTVAGGGMVIDPEIAARLISSRRSTLDGLSPRELEVLQLMAEGHSNLQIAALLHLSAGAISKHVSSIFLKLQLPPGEDNRRVRAVLTYLTARGE